MQDRDIFMDVLAGTKHSISCYTNAIVETSNQQLRSTWQTLRDEAEQMQYQLYQMAEQKGYYMPAPPAHQEDVQKVKSSLSSAVNNTPSNNNMNMMGNTNMNMMNNTNMNMMNNVDMGIPNNNNKIQSGAMPSNLSSSSNQGLTSSTAQMNRSNKQMKNSKDRH